MLCDKCHENEAIIRRIIIINGKKYEQKLCVQCAKDNANAYKMPSLAELLSNVQAPETESSVCECGASIEEFRNSGLLGCEHCYTSLREELMPIIRQAQGGKTMHLGKKPGEAADRNANEIRQLRTELNAAVEKEEYERAAEIRDRIHAIESEATAK